MYPGADPGFQVRGGAHLKKLCQAEGGTQIFGVFRMKNHDFMSKNHIFSNFCSPPPVYRYINLVYCCTLDLFIRNKFIVS